MASSPELLEFVEELQNLLISEATGGPADAARYRALRDAFVADPRTSAKLPRFVRTCRDLHQFWQFIKHKFGTYKERREFLYAEFQPLLEELEHTGTPMEKGATDALKRLTTETVQEVWGRALSRRVEDPDGAITSARTLLETVCKHILDDAGREYADDADLPRLYKLTALELNLAPSQHTEPIFKQILGGCSSVVEGLGALRNKLGDAHGRGKSAVKPTPRHAQLAVNLAGAAATFLFETWEARKGTA
jgi:hypothetical protein